MGDGVSLLEQRESQEDPGWQKRRAVHLRGAHTRTYTYPEVTIVVVVVLLMLGRFI